MVGIIFIGDLYVCPYLHRYVDACESLNLKYEVLFWNRCGEKLQVQDNYRYFDMHSEEEQPFYTKSVDFLKYRIWLTKQLRVKKYDKLIVLSTLSGIVIADVLRKYKGKYLFDIRDYSYERLKPFYLMEQSIVKNSAYTTISSPGFRNFLPPHDYYVIHNMQSSEANYRGGFSKKQYGETLNLVWNGTMRYFEHQKNVMERLANDFRFMMYFHGSGPELDQYQQFAQEKHISNVGFTGRYNNTQKIGLLENADILNNSYWIDNVNEVLYALSNRYYDGLIYRIPQLVEANTYKTGICEENGIGIGIDARAEDFADRLYEWYFKIDEARFEQNCESLLQNALQDDEKVSRRLVEFLTV